MIKNMLGIAIGAALDRRHGDSGVKGAIEGFVAEAAIKTTASLIFTFAIGWAVQHAAKRALHSLSGHGDSEAIEAKDAA